MQEEAEKIKRMKIEKAKQMNDMPCTWSAMIALPTSLFTSQELKTVDATATNTLDKPETGGTSKRKGSVDYEIAVKELNEHSKNCGPISKTTIPFDENEKVIKIKDENANSEDAEKKEMKKWIREMQAEAEKIKKIKSEEAKRMNDTPSTWSAIVALPTTLDWQLQREAQQV
ncbi:hypothetical protein HELRODRAFT_165542 [Helobdella robusta]|uniref:Uncharacterized protein n=1 Tax=Helobdella robusta TaxID=6412 RepID=T1EWZ8_HELRO|nr:hypothetical protein HELRODRAFT_165542 [Helobdella robusta]ESN91500.1 hypothetical protein HELRODRAFT_165542 [Helobdella robusta]